MKVLLGALIAALLLIQGTTAQATSQLFDGDMRGRAQAQSAELAEADRLNQTIVQLHKEGKDDEALSLAGRVLEIRERVSARIISLSPSRCLISASLISRNENMMWRSRFTVAPSPYLKRVPARTMRFWVRF